MNFPEIKFIFFDFGKVIVNFDHQHACENVARLADVSADAVNKALYESGLQNEYEIGTVDSDEFAKRLNQSLNCELSVEQICLAISDIFSLNAPIMPLITQLALADFPIGVLSNTCEAHWNFVLERWPTIRYFFAPQRRVLSYEQGVAKPDPKIYQAAIETAGVAAENIFFLDDLPDNVAGAQSVSIQAELYQSTNQIVKCLIDRNIRINL